MEWGGPSCLKERSECRRLEGEAARAWGCVCVSARVAASFRRSWPSPRKKRRLTTVRSCAGVTERVFGRLEAVDEVVGCGAHADDRVGGGEQVAVPFSDHGPQLGDFGGGRFAASGAGFSFLGSLERDRTACKTDLARCSIFLTSLTPNARKIWSGSSSASKSTSSGLADLTSADAMGGGPPPPPLLRAWLRLKRVGPPAVVVWAVVVASEPT